MKKKNIEISYDELMNELEKYRPEYAEIKSFTQEQVVFLKACRENSRPINWNAVAELWGKRGWGKVKAQNLARRYKDRIR